MIHTSSDDFDPEVGERTLRSMVSVAPPGVQESEERIVEVYREFLTEDPEMGVLGLGDYPHLNGLGFFFMADTVLFDNATLQIWVDPQGSLLEIPAG